MTDAEFRTFAKLLEPVALHASRSAHEAEPRDRDKTRVALILGTMMVLLLTPDRRAMEVMVAAAAIVSRATDGKLTEREEMRAMIALEQAVDALKQGVH